MTDTTMGAAVKLRDFFDYLLGRAETRDVALELANVYDRRSEQRPAVRVDAAMR
jgi:hypothetical protein